MRFIRTGPRFLFIRSRRQEKLRGLLAKLGAEVCTLFQALERGSENTTILFLTDQVLDKTRVEDAEIILFAPRSSEELLAELVSTEASPLLEAVKFGPAMLHMRYLENAPRVLEELSAEYEGVKTNIYEGITRGELGDTLVALAGSSLNRRLHFQETFKPYLLVNRHVSDLYRELDNDAMMYISRSLEARKWREFEICLYDSAGQDKLHYRRLMRTLNDLEAGIMIGEGWSEDHPFVMLTVLVYKLRLFSYLEAMELKRILLGLEYHADGERMVDFDLFARGKKITWLEKKLKEKHHRRNDLGLAMRAELYPRLSAEARAQLAALEATLPREPAMGSSGPR